jgi:hypothetical protein
VAVVSYAFGKEKAEDLEHEIVRFMDRNLWWKRMGIGTPEVLPKELSKIGFLVDYNSRWSVTGRLQGIVVYHFLMGKLIGLFTRDNVVTAYYAGRILSFLLFVGSLYIIYLTFLKFGTGKKEKVLFLSSGFLFILFLPQFLILSVSVHPDALSIFLSTLFFFSAYSLIIGHEKILFFLLLLLSAGAGFLTDRSTFFLIFLILLTPLFMIKRKDYKKFVVYGLAFVVVVLILASITVQIFPLQVENSFNLLNSSLKRGMPMIPRLFSLDDFSRQFLLLAADSFLFRFGWMVFRASPISYLVWRLSILFAAAGIVIFLGRFAYTRLKKSLSNSGLSGEFNLVLFSLIAFIGQLAGLWIFYGTNGILVQGRHFFPLALPLAFLFTVGLKNFFDLFHRKGGLAVLSVFVLFEFLFFSFALWNYIVPVFHLTVQGPHAGI